MSTVATLGQSNAPSWIGFSAKTLPLSLRSEGVKKARGSGYYDSYLPQALGSYAIPTADPGFRLDLVYCKTEGVTGLQVSAVYAENEGSITAYTKSPAFWPIQVQEIAHDELLVMSVFLTAQLLSPTQGWHSTGRPQETGDMSIRQKQKNQDEFERDLTKRLGTQVRNDLLGLARHLTEGLWESMYPK